MYIKKVTALLDEAKKLHKQDIPVEIEVRIGSIENGTFKAGVPRGRYNMMMDWFQQSNLTTTGNWTTSIAHFTGKHERCIITKDTPGSVKNIELVEKKPVGSIILSSNHPEGIALRFCVYTEKPLPTKGTVTTEAWFGIANERVTPSIPRGMRTHFRLILHKYGKEHLSVTQKNYIVTVKIHDLKLSSNSQIIRI